MMKFSGLMSQWMMPSSCAKATAESACSAKSSALAVAMRRRQAIAEGLLAERGHSHEPARDEVGVLEREDVRVVEARGQADLAIEVLESVGRHASPHAES